MPLCQTLKTFTNGLEDFSVIVYDRKKCPRVEKRIECIECGYPMCESYYQLMPHGEALEPISGETISDPGHIKYDATMRLVLEPGVTDDGCEVEECTAADAVTFMHEIFGVYVDVDACDKDNELESLRRRLEIVKGNAERWEQLAINLKRKFAEPDLRTTVESLKKQVSSLRVHRDLLCEKVTSLRRGLDKIKVRAYQMGQLVLHDMALTTLQGDEK